MDGWTEVGARAGCVSDRRSYRNRPISRRGNVFSTSAGAVALSPSCCAGATLGCRAMIFDFPNALYIARNFLSMECDAYSGFFPLSLFSLFEYQMAGPFYSSLK